MSLKRLRNSLGTYLSCVKASVRWGIPIQIDGEERIMRTLFHSANFNLKNNKLRPNCMRPPSRPDEDDPSRNSNKVSTTRYDYAGLEFCRDHARAHQSEPDRHYWGFARFMVNRLVEPRMAEGWSFVCAVKNKPASDNPAHANIEYGFWCEEGVTTDSKVTEYLKQLVASAEVAQDPNPLSPTWDGSPYDAAKYRELKYKSKKK